MDRASRLTACRSPTPSPLCFNPPSIAAKRREAAHARYERKAAAVTLLEQMGLEPQLRSPVSRLTHTQSDIDAVNSQRHMQITLAKQTVVQLLRDGKSNEADNLLAAWNFMNPGGRLSDEDVRASQ